MIVKVKRDDAIQAIEKLIAYYKNEHLEYARSKYIQEYMERIEKNPPKAKFFGLIKPKIYTEDDAIKSWSTSYDIFEGSPELNTEDYIKRRIEKLNALKCKINHNHYDIIELNDDDFWLIKNGLDWIKKSD